MHATHYAWLTAAGLCTVLAPGTPLWLVPVAGFGAQVAYELDPEAGRDRARRLLGAARQRLQLLSPDAPAAPLARREAGQEGRREAPATAPATEAGGELFDALEATPHRLIIGHTRGGKTTLVHHMATSWAARGDRVLVADPDAAPGLWPGCTVRGHGDDIAAIGELLAVVAGEVEARRRQRAQGVRRFEPLHLVIDEAQDVLPVVEGGLELFEDVARRGGKLNVRMTIGVQDKQVKTLGLEGKSEVLRNLQVADVLKSRDGRRVAVLRDAETGQKVSMAIPPLLDPETLITPAAPAPAPVATPTPPAPAAAPLDLSNFLDELLAAPVSSASGRQDTPAAVSVSAPSSWTQDTGHGGVSTTSATVTPDSHGVTIHVNATAAAAPARSPQRGPRGRGGLDVRRRRQQAAQTRQDDERQRRAARYAEKKAAGWSYRKAYAEIGGNSDEARAAWHAAPGPQK